MIQRIQTIYLAISIICMGLVFLFPFATYTFIGEPTTFESFTGLGFEKGTNDFFTFPVIINIFLSIILSILAILSFKNRKRQILITKINFITVLLLVVFIFANFNFIESFLSISKENISYGIGMFLPIVALVAIIMAYRAIKKDEDLIKSMDRIR